jgi:hypothetical protein
VTRRLPLFPLGTVLFPGGPLALRIFEKRYIDMVSRCLREGTSFAVMLLKEGAEAGAASVSTAIIGTEARLVDFDRLEDGLLGLTCVGAARVRILDSWRETDGLNVADVEDVAIEPAMPVPGDCAHLVQALRGLYPQLPAVYEQWIAPDYDNACWVGNRLSELAPFDSTVRQQLLEMTDPVARLRYLAPLVRLDDGNRTTVRSGRAQERS